MLALLAGTGGSTAVSAADDDQPYADMSDPRNQALIQTAKAAYEADQQARQQTPLQRQLSRTAYANLPGAQALQVDGQKLPDPITSPAFRFPQLPNGQELVRYLGQSSALVDTGDGSGPSLLESTLPLHPPGDDSSPAPLDLTLQDAGDHLSPQNPLVSVQVAKDPAQGVSLPDPGITMRPEVNSGPAPQLAQGKAFFANALTDTDLLVAAEPTGAETFAVLRSESAPEELRFDFDLPDGATLQAASDWGIDYVEIVKDGESLAQIAAPSAEDSEGRPVPVSLDVQGDTLVLSVPHVGADFTYPLLSTPR